MIEEHRFTANLDLCIVYNTNACAKVCLWNLNNMHNSFKYNKEFLN